MCMEWKKVCVCGERSASFNLRDNVMMPEVIAELYCPRCSSRIDSFDPETMLNDNGWVIVYDMVLARAIAEQKLSEGEMTPAKLFDEGWATWKEIYPGELEESAEEKAEIVALAEKDPKAYFTAIREWATKRAMRLKKEGWRKAQAM